MLVSTSDETVFINKAGLKFFDCSSVNDFKSKYKNINHFFIEEEGCLNKYSSGKRWLESIFKTKSKRARVKIKAPSDNNMDYYFYIQLSKTVKGRYILSLTDIQG
jgi:hypothetical protein